MAPVGISRWKPPGLFYRKFKKQTDRNLVVTETRARRFFEPQTERRKKQKINAKKKLLKRLYMLRRYESRL